MATTADKAKVTTGAVMVRPATFYIVQALRYLLYIAIGVVMFLPFILAFLGSFKTDAEIIRYPPVFLPTRWLWQNWVQVWNTDIGQGGTFPRWLTNTAFLSFSLAFLRVIFCSLTAYAFARLQFPGKDLVFTFMLGTMMIPDAVKLIPAYVLMTKLRLINTFWSLILPGLIDAGSIFLLTQFFKSIPKDLEEAAFMDGASYLQSYRSVVLPLARPALLTVFILQFQGAWNDFLKPLLYLTSPDKYVLNVALSIFQQQYKAQWNLTLVGAMVNAIPILIMFFIFSRYYIQGVAYAGVKG